MRKTTKKNKPASKPTAKKTATKKTTPAATTETPTDLLFGIWAVVPKKDDVIRVGDIVNLKSDAKNTRGLVKEVQGNKGEGQQTKVQFEGKKRETSHLVSGLIKIASTDFKAKKVTPTKTETKAKTAAKNGNGSLFGLTKAEMLRWMGSNGFTRKEAHGVFGKLGVDLVSSSTQLKEGRDKTKDIPTLNVKESKKLVSLQVAVTAEAAKKAA